MRYHSDRLLFCSFEEKSKQYHPNFFEEFAQVPVGCGIWIQGFFDPKFDEQVIGLLKNRPDLVCLIFERNPIDQKKEDFCDRADRFLGLGDQISIEIVNQDPMLFSFSFLEIETWVVLKGKTASVQEEKKWKNYFNRLQERIFHFQMAQMEKMTQVTLFSHFCSHLEKTKAPFFIADFPNYFASCPAVICGGGPSLKLRLDWIRKIENKALILAAGRAISLLSDQKISPDLLVAVCPRESEYVLLKDHVFQDHPLITSTRMHPDALKLFKGPIGYSVGLHSALDALHLKIQGKDPVFFKHPHSCMTVAAHAIEQALYLGCDPIILVGVDWADLDVKKGERRKKNQAGQWVKRTFEWDHENEWLKKMISFYPEIDFYSLSHCGLRIKNLKSIDPLSCSLFDQFLPLDKNQRIEKMIGSTQSNHKNRMVQIQALQEDFQNLIQEVHLALEMLNNQVSFYDFRFLQQMEKIQSKEAYRFLFQEAISWLDWIDLNGQEEDKEKIKLEGQLKWLSVIVPKYLNRLEESKLC